MQYPGGGQQQPQHPVGEQQRQQVLVQGGGPSPIWSSPGAGPEWQEQFQQKANIQPPPPSLRPTTFQPPHMQSQYQAGGRQQLHAPYAVGGQVGGMNVLPTGMNIPQAAGREPGGATVARASARGPGQADVTGRGGPGRADTMDRVVGASSAAGRGRGGGEGRGGGGRAAGGKRKETADGAEAGGGGGGGKRPSVTKKAAAAAAAEVRDAFGGGCAWEPL